MNTKGGVRENGGQEIEEFLRCCMMGDGETLQILTTDSLWSRSLDHRA